MPIGSLRVLPPLVAAGVLALIGGCSSPGSTASPSGGTVAPASVDRSAETADRVEALYIAGPRAARALGYRVDWQDPGVPGSTIVELVASGDAVFARDSYGFIARYRDDSGSRLWRVPMLEANSRTFGLTYIPSDDRLYASVGSEFHVYVGGTGELVDRQSLTRIGNTAPVVHGQFLIYGSRDGNAVWHRYQRGQTWKAYNLANGIELPPAYSDGFVVVAGNDGSVSSLVAGNAARVWTKQTLDRIVGAPAAGSGMAFVASMDQHLRAWPLDSNRSTPAWDYLAPAPLTDGPVVIGDAVYQDVPGTGLLKFEARPLDAPGGRILWTSESASGTVMTRNGEDLVVWDTDTRTMHILDDRTGAIIESVELPDVTSLLVDRRVDGDLYLGGTGGRVQRLTPTN